MGGSPVLGQRLPSHATSTAPRGVPDRVASGGQPPEATRSFVSPFVSLFVSLVPRLLFRLWIMAGQVEGVRTDC
jgi:hypothetical protein